MLIDQNRLSRAHMEALFHKKENAIIIKNFFDKAGCREIGDRFRNDLEKSKTSGSDIYTTNAVPFFNTIGNKEKYRIYFENAVRYMHDMRSISQPWPYPADLFRLQLDEVWPGGARLLTKDAQKMLFGICRLWKAGSQGLPHQDVLRREVPDSPFAQTVSCQIGINVYMTTPNGGGELIIWDRIVTDAEWAELNVPGSYGFPSDVYEEHSYETYSPEAGDLAIINTEFIHAISPTLDGDRLTISGFGAMVDLDSAIRLTCPALWCQFQS